MDKRFWHCTDMAAVYRLLRQGIQAEIQRLKEAKALREMRPITEAKHYIQQHYQEALRLEDKEAILGSLRSHLENTWIVDEKGNKRKLRHKGEE